MRLDHKILLGRLAAGALAAVAIVAGTNVRTAKADWVSPVVNPSPAPALPYVPSWSGGANTTAQVWTSMAPNADAAPSPSSPYAAQSYSNPNGTPTWYDASASTDGAFVIGSAAPYDVYSATQTAPAGYLTPTAAIPGFNIPGNQLNVVAEVQFYGTPITADLTATYTDPSGVAQAITVDPGSANMDYANGTLNNVGFGEAAMTVALWSFTLPQDTSNLTLTWGWGALDSGIEDMAVYTQSVAAVPEPASLALAAIAAAGFAAFAWRRRSARKATITRLALEAMSGRPALG